MKLTDFGIAKLLDADATKLTATGRTLGTAAYMAPEQIRGTPEVSHKTDLYALGCLFYQMLTGQTPFQGTQLAVLMNCHLTQDPPRPSGKSPDLPLDLDRLVVELMAKEPRDRPLDAEVVADRLRTIQAKDRVASRSAWSSAVRWSRASRRSRRPGGRAVPEPGVQSEPGRGRLGRHSHPDAGPPGRQGQEEEGRGRLVGPVARHDRPRRRLGRPGRPARLPAPAPDRRAALRPRPALDGFQGAGRLDRRRSEVPRRAGKPLPRAPLQGRGPRTPRQDPPEQDIRPAPGRSPRGSSSRRPTSSRSTSATTSWPPRPRRPATATLPPAPGWSWSGSSHRISPRSGVGRSSHMRRPAPSTRPLNSASEEIVKLIAEIKSGRV